MRRLRNYEKELQDIYSAMLWNIWNLIEKYGVGDDCCEIPKQFAERILRWRKLCEVDIDGRTYDVDEVQVEIRCGTICLSITSDGYEYSVTDSDGVLTCLKAVHEYFSMRDIWKKEKTDMLEKAIKYVEEHLLERVYVETIRLSLRNIEEMRRSLDRNITEGISDLLDDFGSDNNLPSGWYEEWYGFYDLEDIFWKLNIDLDKDED